MAEQISSTENHQQISIHAQYVKDLSFESPAAPDCFVKTLGQPDVQIGVNVTAQRVNETLFEVELKLTATAKVEDKTLFVAELVYAGLMSATNVLDDSLKPLMMIEGPRLLFPFARAIMSEMTRDGGFLPLNLNPIDFVAFYKNNMSVSREDKKN
jgi:preprotein translocase subunit SecB